jgi:cell wall-associated NlpC family hydrolase
MTRTGLMIDLAREDIGKIKYLLGAKLGPGDLPLHPNVDCSGAIHRWVERALLAAPLDMVTVMQGGVGVLIPTQKFLARFHGSANQGDLCRHIPLTVALGPTGAGCFLFMRPSVGGHGHVALSLGWGKTIESRGGAGVCEVGPFTNLRRKWDYAGKVDSLFLEVGAR